MINKETGVDARNDSACIFKLEYGTTHLCVLYVRIWRGLYDSWVFALMKPKGYFFFDSTPEGFRSSQACSRVRTHDTVSVVYTLNDLK